MKSLYEGLKAEDCAACSKHWYPIVDWVFDTLRKFTSTVVILQVKEKFGGLRIYWSCDEADSNKSWWIHKIVTIAEDMGSVTCEHCGKYCIDEVKERDTGWIMTLCNECYQKVKDRRADAGT